MVIAKIDSCSLIWAVKSECFNILEKIYDKIIITREVEKETVTEGLKKGFTDAEIIQKIIRDKKISVIDTREKCGHKLGKGESETIAESMKEMKNGKIVHFLCQDNKAKKAAISDNIITQGIEISLLEAVLTEIITEQEFYEKLALFNQEFCIPIERTLEIQKFFELNKKK